MTRSRSITLALVVLLLAGSTAAASGLGARRTPPPALHPRYRLVGNDGVMTDGPYTLLGRLDGGRVIGTLLDERSGARRLLRLPRFCPRPGGVGPRLGDAYVLADCDRDTLALYSLARNDWRALAIHGPCRDRAPGYCPAEDVGSRWVQYDDGTPRTGDVYVFQNIATGRIRRDPATRHVVADLDAAALAHRLCAPLVTPHEGFLAGEGRFVLEVEEGAAYLEECGTRLHVPLGPSVDVPVIGPRMVVGLSGPRGPLRGISLSELRRFTISVPRGADSLSAVALGDDHIYVEALTHAAVEDVWSAPLPVPPL